MNHADHLRFGRLSVCKGLWHIWPQTIATDNLRMHRRWSFGRLNLWQQTWNATMGRLHTIIKQEYCSSHSNAVTCHFKHACVWNLSLILCANGQLKGESACNCKKYVRHCVTDCYIGATKKISNCPPTSHYCPWQYYSMLVIKHTCTSLSCRSRQGVSLSTLWSSNPNNSCDEGRTS